METKFMLDMEILADFQTEAKGLLDELTEIVETLEESSGTFPAADLEQFAQKIDRIMGAAQTLEQLSPGHAGLQRIGAIAQICKKLGYKAAEYKTISLIPIFAAFWADTIEVLGELVTSLNDEAKNRSLAASFASVLQNRLSWLGEKVQALGKASGADLQSQLEIDKIMAGFKG